jgi:hypothetical protein
MGLERVRAKLGWRGLRPFDDMLMLPRLGLTWLDIAADPDTPPELRVLYELAHEGLVEIRRTRRGKIRIEWADRKALEAYVAKHRSDGDSTTETSQRAAVPSPCRLETPSPSTLLPPDATSQAGMPPAVP